MTTLPRGASPSRIIGPFLGLDEHTSSTRIFLGLPESSHEEIVTCHLSRSDGTLLSSISSQSEHAPYQIFSWRFENLTPRQRYTYSFVDSSGNTILPEGLNSSDLYFYGSDSQWNENDSFILMSCHNPLKVKSGYTGEGWAMWTKLKNLLDLRESQNDLDSLRLLILAGDQLYNDQIEIDWMKKLKEASSSKKDQEPQFEKVRRALINNYHLFWNHPDYRKVLARIPSLVMWDDHDITDGWGGRLESFKVKGQDFLPEWIDYFNLCREAYIAYQGIRNPAALFPNVFTTSLDIGTSRFLMMDQRSEKNAKAGRLMSLAHENALLDYIEKTPQTIQNLFVVSPVVPLRTNFEGDKRLDVITRCFFSLEVWSKKSNRMKRFVYPGLVGSIGATFLSLWMTSVWPMNFPVLEGILNSGHWLLITLIFALTVLFFGIIVMLVKVPELPDLTDDLEDGLSSEVNMAYLQRLLLSLFKTKKEKRIQPIFLTGDIHSAGITEILDRSGNTVHRIPQIVASPISYSPMPKAALGMTTTTSEMELQNDAHHRLFARNIFYTSKRNFCEIIPAQIQKNGKSIRFYWEGHELPMEFSDRY